MEEAEEEPAPPPSGGFTFFNPSQFGLVFFRFLHDVTISKKLNFMNINLRIFNINVIEISNR